MAATNACMAANTWGEMEADTSRIKTMSCVASAQIGVAGVVGIAVWQKWGSSSEVKSLGAAVSSFRLK